MSFVTAGALAGLGSGMQEEVANTRKVQATEVAAAREQKLRELEMEFRSTEAGKTRTFEGEQADKKYTRDLDVVGKQGKNAMDVQTSKEAAEDVQKGKDRQNKLDVQKLKNQGASQNKTQKSRWQFKTTPATSTIDMATGKPVNTPAQVVVSDTMSGTTLVQAGRPFTDSQGKTIGYENNFYPPNVDPKSTRRAPRAAIQNLLANPDSSDDFLGFYGYLPAAYIKAQQAMQTTSQGQRGPAPKDSDNEDDE